MKVSEDHILKALQGTDMVFKDVFSMFENVDEDSIQEFFNSMISSGLIESENPNYGRFSHVSISNKGLDILKIGGIIKYRSVMSYLKDVKESFLNDKLSLDDLILELYNKYPDFIIKNNHGE